MELRITAFRGSPWLQGNTHEAVLEVRGRNANPDQLLGAHLVWRTQTGRVVRGKVVKRHGHLTGNKVLARFHKGLPGQALGTTVEVRGATAQKAERRAKVAPAQRTRAPARPAPAKVSKASKDLKRAQAAKDTKAAKAGKPAKAPKAAEARVEGIRITRVQFDAPGPEATRLTREWVEIANFSAQVVDFGGWKLQDRKEHTFEFPEGFRLAPGKTVRVRTGKGDDTPEDLHWGRAAAVWNNEDDTAFLYDADGGKVARHRWSLIEDKAEPAPVPVKVLAVQFDAPGPEATRLTREWVLLSNEATQPADLTGWKLKDKADHTFEFPEGFALAPGAAVRVRTGVGEDTAQDLFWGRKAAVWNNEGDKAEVLDANGQRVATYTWSPDGTWATYRLPA